MSLARAFQFPMSGSPPRTSAPTFSARSGSDLHLKNAEKPKKISRVAESARQPGTSERPEAVRRSPPKAHGLSCVVVRKPSKVAQFHQFGRPRAVFPECLVDCQHGT
jgi:hypothetical protein